MFNKLGDLAVGDWYRLPRQGHGICYWGGDSPDTDQAMATLQSGQSTASQDLKAALAAAQEMLAPWTKAGGAAVGQIGGLLALPGYTALDPTKTLMGTPGYQFLQDQGTQALARYGAATGLGLSGPAAKGATDYGMNLAQKYAWQPYMSSLQDLSKQGLSGAGTVGGWDIATGGALAGLATSSAQQQAQLEMQKATMEAQQQSSLWNDIMSGVGFGVGAIAAPFTGGTSLLGSFGSLFGGGGTGSNYTGALSGAPGMNLSQLYSGFSGSNQAFNPSSAGGWLPIGSYMADGGPTVSNRPYIVGERGPEMFVPNVPGYIVPNEYMRYSTFSHPYRMAA